MVYRTDGLDAATTMPAVGTVGTEGFPSDTTDIDPYFIAALCEEIRNVALADGIAPAKAVTSQMLQAAQNGGVSWGTDTGAAGAYVVAPARTPGLLYPAALKAGMEIAFIATNGPNTGACTLNYCALGVKNLLSNAGAAFAGGDIIAGALVVARYNGVAWMAASTGQAQQKPRYLASQTGSISPAANSNNSVASVAITFPASSRTGAFRVLARLVSHGTATAANSWENFINSLSDGTNSFQGATWPVYVTILSDQWGCADMIRTSGTYAPGSTVTFTQYVSILSASTTFTISGCLMELYVEEA